MAKAKKAAPVKTKRAYVRKSAKAPRDRRPQKRNTTGLVPFKKGDGRKKGRVAGVPNKFTMKLKDAILQAAELSGSNGRGKGGLVGYLVWLSRNEPAVFGRMMEKAMPVQLEVKDKTDRTMNAQEAVERLKERGLPIPPALLSLAGAVGAAIVETQARDDEEAFDEGIDVDADEDSNEDAPIEGDEHVEDDDE